MGWYISAGPPLRGPAHDEVQRQVPEAADGPREGDHRESQGGRSTPQPERIQGSQHQGKTFTNVAENATLTMARIAYIHFIHYYFTTSQVKIRS